MPKWPIVTCRQMARVLEKIGFVRVRQKGSHRFYRKGDIGLIVPIHTGDMKTGTVQQIVKRAGLTVEDFIRFLTS